MSIRKTFIKMVSNHITMETGVKEIGKAFSSTFEGNTKFQEHNYNGLVLMERKLSSTLNLQGDVYKIFSPILHIQLVEYQITLKKYINETFEKTSCQ